MCEACQTDSDCRHPSCAANPSGCACSLSGPAKCPTCGHDCEPWWFGLGVVEGPDWVQNLLGGAGTESPGFSEYPATRAQVLAAAQGLLEDMRSDEDVVIQEPGWLAARLPEGTYRDPGELFCALEPVLHAPPVPPAGWLAQLRTDAIATGTRLSVPAGTSAFLFGAQQQLLDAFPTGEHTITRANAPLASALSRPAAPGVARTVLRASIMSLTAQEIDGRIRYSGRTAAGAVVVLQATTRVRLEDPARFARAPPSKGLSPQASLDTLLTRIVEPALAKLDASTFDGDHGALEAAVRAALTEAGWGMRTLNIEAAGPPSAMAPIFRPGTPGAPGPAGGIPPEAMAHLPPQVQAMMQAKMNEAMARRANAPLGGGPGPSGAGAPRPPTPGGLPHGLVACPACRGPNPVGLKVCRFCGRPMPA